MHETEDNTDQMIEHLEFQNGLSQIHIYVWILKDLAWASNMYYLGISAGTAAVSFILILAVACRHDAEEVFANFVLFLWIFGNFLWMSGEITIPPLGMDAKTDDNNFHDDGTTFFGDDAINAAAAMGLFIVALVLITLYYSVLSPRKYLTTHPIVIEYYERAGVKPRFPNLFRSMRQYEYLHMLFWIGKDLAWNRLWPVPWGIFFVLTFAVGADFVYITYQKGYWVDCAHYSAQFLWVLANFAWGLGEQFFKGYDNAIPLSVHNKLALSTGRWWAQLILVLAYVPLIALYLWQILVYYQSGSKFVRSIDQDGVPRTVHLVSACFSSVAAQNAMRREINAVKRGGQGKSVELISIVPDNVSNPLA